MRLSSTIASKALVATGLEDYQASNTLYLGSSDKVRLHAESLKSIEIWQLGPPRSVRRIDNGVAVLISRFFLPCQSITRSAKH